MRRVGVRGRRRQHVRQRQPAGVPGRGRRQAAALHRRRSARGRAQRRCRRLARPRQDHPDDPARAVGVGLRRRRLARELARRAGIRHPGSRADERGQEHLRGGPLPGGQVPARDRRRLGCDGSLRGGRQPSRAPSLRREVLPGRRARRRDAAPARDEADPRPRRLRVRRLLVHGDHPRLGLARRRDDPDVSGDRPRRMQTARARRASGPRGRRRAPRRPRGGLGDELRTRWVKSFIRT